MYNIPALAQKLDLLPQSVYFTYSPDEIIAQRAIQSPFDNYLQQKIHRAYFIHTYDSSNCYQDFFEENLYEKYIQGCGGPYYGFFNGNGYYMHNLVYYKKGNHTWGTPLSNKKSQSNFLAVSLRPMPCKDFVTLSFAQKPFEGTATVYDILGQKLDFQQINSTKEYRLALGNHLPAGMYHLALRQPDGLTQMVRFVKE